jgi:hypothetical protein
VLPLQVLAAYVSRDQLGETFDFGASSVSGAFDDTGAGTADWLMAYVATIPLILIGAALGRLVAGWYSGTDLGTRDLLRALGPRIPALLVCWVVIHVVETVAIMTCIGVLFVWPLVLCCGPAIGVEELGIRAGLRRSFKLGSRRYWECFWVAFCAGIVSQVLSISLALLPTLLADVMGETWGWLVLAAGNTAASLITIPFVAAAAALAYLDVRVRTEGLDLELRAVEILGKATPG